MAGDEVRPLRLEEQDEAVRIVNAAAQRYRGAIPEDCWREPYMPADELAQETAAGVRFWALARDGRLEGVMGVQAVRDVELIRHAYVRPEAQGQGIGARLLRHLVARRAAPMLVGTWSAASWAIGFYERHGFERVPAADIAGLLRRYWDIPDRQLETSTVLRLRPSVAVSPPVRG